MEKKRLSAHLTVRSYELDGYGHVNNATYLQYLEYARVEYMKQVGLQFLPDSPDELRIFVVNANLNFKAPAFIDEQLDIVGGIKKFGNSSCTIKQDIYNIKTGAYILDAEVTIVFIDQNGKPTRIPKQFKEAFTPYLLASVQQ